MKTRNSKSVKTRGKSSSCKQSSVPGKTSVEKLASPILIEFVQKDGQDFISCARLGPVPERSPSKANDKDVQLLKNKLSL
jgi:hypothetical protein